MSFARFRNFLFFLSLFPGLLSPRLLAAAEVTVLLSDDKVAYNEALGGLENIVPGSMVFNMKGDSDLGRQILRQIRSEHPRVLVTIGARAADLARSETPEIPLVYCMVVNPDEYNLSGENITGVKLQIPPFDQFNFIKQMLPKVKIIGTIYDPAGSKYLVDLAREAASQLGLVLLDYPITSQQEISGEVKKLIGKIDLFWLIPDTTIISRDSFKYILTATIENEIPMLTFSSNLAKSGALISLSPDYRSSGLLAGKMAREILGGKSPREVKPLYPEREIALNLTAAESLGIKIPEQIKRKAKYVY
ncbi:MAG: ABC transporter substrate-binding protein [bacterium]|nr:ABC transporter substrate-binding protein [bacterium]